MTLSETIFQKHIELLSGIKCEEYELSKDDLDKLINESEKHTYKAILLKNHQVGVIKLLIESAKAYREAKWNEGMQAARDAQCSDKNTPPKFIP